MQCQKSRQNVMDCSEKARELLDTEEKPFPFQLHLFAYRNGLLGTAIYSTTCLHAEVKNSGIFSRVQYLANNLNL